MKLESMNIRKVYQCPSTPDTEIETIVRQYSLLLIKTVSSPWKQMQIESLFKKKRWEWKKGREREKGETGRERQKDEEEGRKEGRKKY